MRESQQPSGDTASKRDASSIRRSRALSAAAWGAVGTLAVLVTAQGYVLAGGSLPASLTTVGGLSVAVGVGVSTITYLTEHRISRKRPKRRT